MATTEDGLDPEKLLQEIKEDEKPIADELEQRAARFREVTLESIKGARDISLHLVTASVGTATILGPVLLFTQTATVPSVLGVALVGFGLVIVLGLFAVRRSVRSDVIELKWYFQNVQPAQGTVAQCVLRLERSFTEKALQEYVDAHKHRRAKSKEWYDSRSRAGDAPHTTTWWTFDASMALLGISVIPWGVVMSYLAQLFSRG